MEAAQWICWGQATSADELTAQKTIFYFYKGSVGLFLREQNNFYTLLQTMG